MPNSAPRFWKGRFFRRVFTRLGLLLSTGMVLVCALTWQIMQRWLYEYTSLQLTNHAQLACLTIESADVSLSPDALMASCAEISRRTGLRLTVIATDGRVLADSHAEAATMENHGHRREVVDALAGQVGHDERLSTSVGRSFNYIAVPMMRNGEVAAIVRVAAPVEDFQTREAALIKWVMIGLAVSLPLALIIAYLFSRTLARPVQEVGLLAQRLATGDLDTRVEITGKDEVAQVAESLERMRVHLSERIRQVQQRRQDLEVTLGNLEEGVIAVNEHGVVLQANRAARELLGTEGAVVGWPLTIGLRHAALSTLWSEAIRSKTPELRRDVNLNGPGPQRTVTVTIVRVNEPDTPIAWLLCVNDITELARSSAMKADFVANASHELRTPVAAIRAAVETLRSDGLDGATQSRFMSVIDRNVVRLQDLTEDLMHLNKVESPSAALSPAEFDPADVLALLKMSFAEALRGKNAEFHVTCELAVIVTDQRWLELVLKNLIDNSVKYVGPGGRIDLRCRGEGDRVYFVVQDNGCGIPPQDLERVFERFYQVDKSRDRTVGGTGLGLAIVKHAVHALGGEVSIASEVGRGTTVSFWLPLAPTTAGAAT
ncbi:MAG TPA: ATP-binding protein [Phycisphaerae bacterium]|nr:ATP-binding protein [Phycisphaerae bacterium]